MNREVRLFAKWLLDDLFERDKKELRLVIENIDKEILFSADLDELAAEYAGKYKITVPILSNKPYVLEPEEKTIKVTEQWSPQDETYDVSGVAIEYVVEFEGDSFLFDSRPSEFSLKLPFGVIINNTLHLSYFLRSTHKEGKMRDIENKFHQELASIQDCLNRIKEKVDTHNDQIAAISKSKLCSRKDKLQKANQSLAALGLPIMRRNNAPATYKMPVTRRNLPVRKPGSAPKDSEPLPLSMEEYEHIIHVMFNMGLVMERSPKAFMSMEEEDLRIHFLVQLNGQYEGQATGETFNLAGKTDILIRIDGQNIFIAECKFWRGQQSLLDAIDQLLTYLTFRDTKAAIVLFNKNKDLANVLNQIPSILSAHPSFKEMVAYERESGFRFKLKHTAETSREVLLTTLVFDIPDPNLSEDVS